MFKLTALFLSFIIANVSIVSASDVSHPPTYEQIKKSYKNGDNFNTDLYSAFQYNSDDIQLLKQQESIDYIIAIAYQLDRSEAISLMMEYLTDTKKNVLGLSLLISCALREDKFNEKLPIEHFSQGLIELSPNNGYAYYLMAYYYAKIDNFEYCIKYTEQAVNAATFNNYWADFSENSIKTSVFLGYSKIAAQMYSLGLQHDFFIYYKLADYILNHDSNMNNILLCKKMGSIIKENSTTVLGDYMSMATLKKSFGKLKKYRNTEKDLSSIEDLKAQLKILTDSLTKISGIYDIPEKRWEQYYTDLYEQSEHYAIKKLMNEFPVNIK